MTLDPGWDIKAQQVAEAHLSGCMDALHAQENGDPEEVPETPAFAPFCGCDTCVVREVLMVAWPILRQAALAGAAA